jgi:NAD(P)-dependent dehydrogenase (short-subunit alcohol dehydrogenase family)
MVEEARRELGPIDLLVNNAGVANPSDAPPIWSGAR